MWCTFRKVFLFYLKREVRKTGQTKKHTNVQSLLFFKQNIIAFRANIDETVSEFHEIVITSVINDKKFPRIYKICMIRERWWCKIFEILWDSAVFLEVRGTGSLCWHRCTAWRDAQPCAGLALSASASSPRSDRSAARARASPSRRAFLLVWGLADSKISSILQICKPGGENPAQIPNSWNLKCEPRGGLPLS